MHLVLIVVAALVFAMPITGFGWTEGSNLLIDPHLVCKKSRLRLHAKYYYELCKNEPIILREISRGIKDYGFKECEHQFKHHRWNCTPIARSMTKILLKDTRETSFVSAITAAGITYAVTRACTSGDLVECSCDKNQFRRYNVVEHHTESSIDSNRYSSIDVDINIAKRQQRRRRRHRQQKHHHHQIPRNHRHRHRNKHKTRREHNTRRNVIVPPDGDWQWGGCGDSDNVMFGFRKSKDFLDARYHRLNDIRTLVKLHNHNAGRFAVKSLMHMACKCHGVSGACTIRTCWMKMVSFREIGNRLKERFDGAAKVIARNDGHSFMPEIKSIKQPTRHDLVYTEDSIDFCRFNAKTGSLGTKGRECNATSATIDGCDLMCCNRGYEHKIIWERINCQCMFKWCCEVICSTCYEQREFNTCK